MSWVKVGVWLVGTGLALVGAAAGVAAVQQLTEAGIAGIAVGAILALLGFVLLAFGGRAYVREQERVERERTARELERAQFEIERLEFEKERLRFDRELLEAQQERADGRPRGALTASEFADASYDSTKPNTAWRLSGDSAYINIPGYAPRETVSSILETQLETTHRRELQIDQEIDGLRTYTARLGNTTSTAPVTAANGPVARRSP